MIKYHLAGRVARPISGHAIWGGFFTSGETLLLQYFYDYCHLFPSALREFGKVTVGCQQSPSLITIIYSRLCHRWDLYRVLFDLRIFILLYMYFRMSHFHVLAPATSFLNESWSNLTHLSSMGKPGKSLCFRVLWPQGQGHCYYL